MVFDCQHIKSRVCCCVKSPCSDKIPLHRCKYECLKMPRKCLPEYTTLTRELPAL